MLTGVNVLVQWESRLPRGKLAYGEQAGTGFECNILPLDRKKGLMRFPHQTSYNQFYCNNVKIVSVIYFVQDAN